LAVVSEQLAVKRTAILKKSGKGLVINQIISSAPEVPGKLPTAH